MMKLRGNDQRRKAVNRPQRSPGRDAFAGFIAGSFGGAFLAVIGVYHLAGFAADHNFCDPKGPCGGLYPLLVVVAFFVCGVSAAVLNFRIATPRKKTATQRRRTALIAFAALVALAAIVFLPLLGMNGDQDECSFGPVSNAHYRELLAEADRLQATWPPLVADSGKVMDLLNRRLDDLAGSATSIHERVAAMHAVMRALGGHYRRTEPVDRLGVVFYHYEVDFNGLDIIASIWRQRWVVGTLIVYPNAARYVTQDRSRLRAGNIEFGVPRFLDSHAVVQRRDDFCPRFPGAALAAAGGHDAR